MALAVVIRSGTTPSSLQANQSPVRQNPVWISSAMNATPLAVHQAEMAGRNPGAGTMKPPSPWMGSMSTQPVFSTPTWRSICSMARAAASAPVMPSGSR